MRIYPYRFLLLLILVTLAGPSTYSQRVVLNEVLNSGSTNDEWAELLIVEDSVDLRGWSLRDYTSSGGQQPPLVFSSNPLWRSLPKGTIVVIARPENAFPEDLDPGDFLLVIKTGNTAYFSGTAFNFAGTSDAIQILASGTTHEFGLSWGTANQASLPAPRVHFTNGMTSGNAVAFAGGSLGVLTSAGSWAFNTPTATRGTGNSTENSAWIAGFRLNPDGSGTATATPDTVDGGRLTPVVITYHRDTTFAVSDLRVILPPAFVWSRNQTDVTLQHAGGALSVSGDTVLIEGISLPQDSAVITVGNVTMPDSTAVYTILVQSKGATAFRTVSPTPKIVLFGVPEPVALVKQNDPTGVPVRINSLVTVRGVVTVANEFGGPSYLQDNSGGIGVFGSSFSTAVQAGDEVIVSGILQPFSGLSEIVSPVLHAVLGSGNVVDPLVATVKEIRDDGLSGVEEFEGRLVRLNGVRVVGGGTWLPNTNYPLTDGTDTTQLRLDNSTDLVGRPIPAGVFDLVGVVGQFITTSPYIGGYQVMPRTSADVIASGPVFATAPAEETILPASLTIGWTTVNPGSSWLRYGTTPVLELGVVGTTDLSTTHAVTLTGLTPATVYIIQAYSVSGSDTSFASPLIAGTASPPQSTGTINVYFNSSVDTTLAIGVAARGREDLVARLLDRIGGARRSIDAAFYNLSGTPGATIASALINARDRGVRVRVICEQDNRSNAPFNQLSANAIPVLTDAVDPVLRGTGLMHHKVMIVDGRNGAPDSTWVWTGSWNPSQPGTDNDYQNAIEIQDAALAVTFTREFDEMWGGTGDVPAPANVRFGARKLDNTPHRFVIGGRAVECSFSPSDRTTARIIAAIHGARHSVAFALLTMTRSDIRTALVAQHTAGLSVRGVMNDDEDTGSQYSSLLAGGVDVLLKSGPDANTYLLHHKYGIIDAEDPAWNPMTITGSHNWTNSAENSNDENVVIIRDGSVANQYLQEFAARYYQYGGRDSIAVGVDDLQAVPSAYALFQNFPNPFNPTTEIRYQVSGVSTVKLVVYDLLGREVAVLVDEPKAAGRHRITFNAAGLTSGVYLYRLIAGRFVETRKMILLH